MLSGYWSSYTNDGLLTDRDRMNRMNSRVLRPLISQETIYVRGKATYRAVTRATTPTTDPLATATKFPPDCDPTAGFAVLLDASCANIIDAPNKLERRQYCSIWYAKMLRRATTHPGVLRLYTARRELSCAYLRRELGRHSEMRRMEVPGIGGSTDPGGSKEGISRAQANVSANGQVPSFSSQQSRLHCAARFLQPNCTHYVLHVEKSSMKCIDLSSKSTGRRSRFARLGFPCVHLAPLLVRHAAQAVVAHHEGRE